MSFDIDIEKYRNYIHFTSNINKKKIDNEQSTYTVQ